MHIDGLGAKPVLRTPFFAPLGDAGQFGTRGRRGDARISALHT